MTDPEQMGGIEPGRITGWDPQPGVLSFLYILLRDFNPGRVEEITLQAEQHAPGDTFTNPFLLDYARNILQRLWTPPPAVAKRVLLKHTGGGIIHTYGPFTPEGAAHHKERLERHYRIPGVPGLEVEVVDFTGPMP